MAIRLINAKTLELELFPELPPRYAILSHLWERDEIKFEDVLEYKTIKMLKHKAAFLKVEGFCAQAKKEGYDYVWVDTCCIYKASSSELQAAINSMFKWYEKSSKCFVYLSDVYCRSTDAETFHTEFCNSRWFTRGWTLQELLAPSDVSFYNAEWKFLSTAKGLTGLLTSITGIPRDVLIGQTHYLQTSIAQRMSWAAKRQTTVPEDKSYCLMGLFDVNMPLLYGEGPQKAFKRLQYEILVESDDESIFAWFGPGDGSMIAPSPTCFEGSKTITPATRDWCFDPERPPYAVTNKGLRFEPILIDSRSQYSLFRPLNKKRRSETSSWKTTILPLNCVKGPKKQTVAIQLVERGGIYHRLSEDIFVSDESFKDSIDSMALVVSHRKWSETQSRSSPRQLPDSVSSDSKAQVQWPENGTSSELDVEHLVRRVIFIRRRILGPSTLSEESHIRDIGSSFAVPSQIPEVPKRTGKPFQNLSRRFPPESNV